MGASTIDNKRVPHKNFSCIEKRRYFRYFCLCLRLAFAACAIKFVGQPNRHERQFTPRHPYDCEEIEPSAASNEIVAQGRSLTQRLRILSVGYQWGDRSTEG